MSRREQRVVYCERCEARAAVLDIHRIPPIGVYAHVSCGACGFTKIVRDDARPDHPNAHCYLNPTDGDNRDSGEGR